MTRKKRKKKKTRVPFGLRYTPVEPMYRSACSFIPYGCALLPFQHFILIFRELSIDRFDLECYAFKGLVRSTNST